MSRIAKRHDRKPRYGGPRRHTGAARRGKKSGRESDTLGATHDAALVRLQKVMAAAGVGSRRQCEELIREGHVDVDGKTVTELGTRVDAIQQRILVDGQPLRRPKQVYTLVNKPAGILSTNFDPSGRPRVIDLAASHERLFTVGRLDKSSEGLILVTNDGRLTDLLTHPRYGVEKTYLAVVAGVPTPEALAKLHRGVHLAEGFAHAKKVYLRRAHKHSAVLEIVLDEGRNREVRRLLARIGHKVMHLRRVAIGPLRLGNLKPGESRPLRREEVAELYRAAQQRRSSAKASRASTPRRTEKLPAQSGQVHPIIDESLPPEILADEELALDAISFTVENAEQEEIVNVQVGSIARGMTPPAMHRTIIGADDQSRAKPGRQPVRRHRQSRQQGRIRGKHKGR